MPQRRPRPTRTLAGLILITLALGAANPLRAEVPEVVRQIPADAQAFIAVPSLAGLSDELAQFNERSGINQPQLNDVLSQAKSMGNLRQGLNDEGGAAFVLLSAGLPEPDQQGAAPGPPKAALMLPVEDYNAFLQNFGVQDAADDEPVRIEMQGRPAFTKSVGDYAVVSNLSDVVNAFELADETDLPDHVGKFGREALEQSDVLLYMDMAELGPRLQPMMEMGLMEARRRMQQQTPDSNEAEDAKAVAEAMIELYAGAARAFLRDSRAMVAGLDLTENGIGLMGTAQFKPDSELGQTLAEAPEDPVSFDQLPDKPYMLASSVNIDALPIQEWFAQAVDAMPEDNPFASLLNTSLEMMDHIEGEAQQAWYLPEGGGGGPGNFFTGVSVYQSDDPDQLLQSYREVLEEMDGLELGPQTGYTTEYEADVMEVNGHPVDRYKLQFDMSPEQRQQLGPMVAMIGQGFSGYLVATDSAVIGTNGGDPALIKSAIEAAENDSNLEGNLGIGESRSGLPGDRVAEMYLDVGSLMKMGRNFVALFNPNVQIDVPEDLPPVAASGSVSDSGFASRLYIPIKVISAVTDAAKKLQQQGGPGGGNSVN